MLFFRVMALRDIKILPFLIPLCIVASCSTVNRSSSLIEEDKLYVTRIYVGNFLDFRHTASDSYGNPDLIWIETTQDTIHGKISAYSKECAFSPGERLYLRRVLTTNGKNEAWVYQVENSDTVNYEINEYQDHNNVLEAWFNTIPDDPLPSYSISPVKLAQKTDNKTETFSGNK